MIGSGEDRCSCCYCCILLAAVDGNPAGFHGSYPHGGKVFDLEGLKRQKMLTPSILNDHNCCERT